MRSLLFVPGNQERKLAKALSTGADAVILDLEDSVAPDDKARARTLVAAFLADAARVASGPRLYVRINDLGSAHSVHDLAGIMPARPDGIVLPKARSGADVRTLARTLDSLEGKHGMANGATRIVTIATEVPEAIFAMGTYAEAGPRLAGLAWGREDLSAAVGATETRDTSGALTSPFRLARDLTLFAAASAGVAAIDEVHIDYRDGKGLALAAAEAARDGFSGKMAIHPDQVPIINAAFTPSADEIAEAREVVRCFSEAGAWGVVARHGRMLDRPHLKRAERVLERARLAGTEG